jgi:hypothetical protein
MSTGATILVIVVAVIVLGLIGWYVLTQTRRKELRQRFGPEYDRALEDGEDRRAVEHELAEREKRHSQLDIHPLAEPVRERYAQQWTTIQTRFVDQPDNAVAEADRLVTAVMGARGYPTEGYQQQLSDLSVRHASTLDHYRSAHEVKGRSDQHRASTEELREAMVHYRALFEDLLKSDVDDETPTGRPGDATRRHQDVAGPETTR